jgi:hypothetical protein
MWQISVMKCMTNALYCTWASSSTLAAGILCNTLIKTNIFIKQNPFHKERLTKAFYKVA